MIIRIISNHGCTLERDMWGMKEAVMARKMNEAEEERPKILPPHKSKNMVPDGRISFLISNQKSKSYHLQ